MLYGRSLTLAALFYGRALTLAAPVAGKWC
jgi:hypothetical protein